MAQLFQNQIFSAASQTAFPINPGAKWLETQRDNPLTYPFLAASSVVSSSCHLLRTLPPELTLKIIEHALQLSHHTNERISVLQLSILLSGANLGSIDFASRVGSIRSPRLAPLNPSSWRILGSTMPSSITRINLNHLNVEDSFLASLALSPARNSLKTLKLRQNHISIDGLQSLRALNVLESLDVALIPFPAGAITVIAEACPRLQVLFIGKIDGFASTYVVFSEHGPSWIEIPFF
jgi:hypothetical protein